MDSLRPYQQIAVDAVLSAEERRVCLVAPTGAGKTVMGLAAAEGRRTLWITHTLDLQKQTQGQTSHAVRTIQSLTRREDRPDVDFIVWDECHHAVGEDWRTLADAYPNTKILGLTATPQRGDGKGLREAFDKLIIAAQYPELVRDGYLVGARVMAPPEPLDGVALHPVEAYLTNGEGRSGFCYVSRVADAYRVADEFNAAGVKAACIEGESDKDEREWQLKRLAEGHTRILTNVYALTEGVDIPSASVSIIARGIGSASQYLQICGRVLRPYPNKTNALILDLPGVSHAYGSPTDYREYSLDGAGISQPSATPITTCPQCGASYPSGPECCPECGYKPKITRADVRIWDVALIEMFNGELTPDVAKRREWERLIGLAKARLYSIGWAMREYEKLFGARPTGVSFTMDEKRAEFESLAKFATERGYKPGWASHKYRNIFGVWPRGV